MKLFLSFMTIALVIGILCIVIGSTYTVITLGDDESDYNIICLDSHEYWRANFAAKGFLAIKLDDEGKPIQCE